MKLKPKRSCCSMAKLCQTLCNPMDCCSTPGFPVLHHLPEFVQTYVYWVIDAIQPSYPPLLPLLLLPSIFPSIKVCSNESGLPIRWPKFWNFSFSINSSRVDFLGFIKVIHHSVIIGLNMLFFIFCFLLLISFVVVAQLLSRFWLFCSPMDCSRSGSSVHGISQERILEWVAISFLGGILSTQQANLNFLHYR